MMLPDFSQHWNWIMLRLRLNILRQLLLSVIWASLTISAPFLCIYPIPNVYLVKYYCHQNLIQDCSYTASKWCVYFNAAAERLLGEHNQMVSKKRLLYMFWPKSNKISQYNFTLYLQFISSLIPFPLQENYNHPSPLFDSAPRCLYLIQ